jgi:2-dehydropantoate 2-reductase
MAQDIELRRYTEFELFAGADLALSQTYGVSTPINKELYERIKS